MGRAKRITQFLKTHDPLLYCESREGKLCIFRQSKRVESYDYNGVTLTYVRPAPFFIAALTTDWRMNSPAVEWGLLPILLKIKEMDLHSRDIVGELVEQDERDKASSQRHLSNETEAFVKDFRGAFKESTKDVLTHSLPKKDKRRLTEKSGESR